MNLIHSRSLDSNKLAGPLWKRQGYQGAKRELANLQKSKGQAQVPYIPASEKKPQNNKTCPFATSVPGMVASSWGGNLSRTAKFRTPATIIIFKLVTKPSMVEFVFVEPKLAQMALARVARRQMVRQSNSSWKQHAQARSSTLSKSTCEFRIHVSSCNSCVFFYSCFCWQFRVQTVATAMKATECCGHHTYLKARTRTFLSCAPHT